MFAPPRAGVVNGCVVEYTHRGELHCGAIWPHAANGRKLLILDLDGRDHWLSRDKLFDMASQKVPTTRKHQALRDLKLIDGRRREASSQLDLEPLWELALEELETASQKKPIWTLDGLAELYFGELKLEDRPVLLRCLWEGSWFERQVQGWTPLSRAAVSARRRVHQQRVLEERELEEAATWVRHLADGGSAESVPSCADDAVSLLQDAALHGAQPQQADRTPALMARAHLHGPQAAFDVLVRLGVWNEHENLEIHREQVPVEFSAATRDEADGIVPGTIAAPRRWRRPIAFADAGESGASRAFSLQRTLRGYRLRVYVAAPSLYVPRDSASDLEAALRGCTIELLDRTIPLLTPQAEGAARLCCSEHRPALEVEVALSRTLAVKRTRVRLRSVNARNLTGVEWAKAHLGSFAGIGGAASLTELARALRAKRLPDGVDAHGESRLAPRLEGDDVTIEESGSSPFDTMAGEITLAASCALAEYCQKHGVPMVYRISSPDEAPDLRGVTDGRAAAFLRARSRGRESFAVTPQIHEGLGVCLCAGSEALASHEHLVAQRQILALATGEPPPYSACDLERIVSEGVAARVTAERVHDAERRYGLLKALEHRVGCDLRVLVLRRAGLGYIVAIEESDITAFVPVQRELRADSGDYLMVRLEQASARRNLVRLSQPKTCP